MVRSEIACLIRSEDPSESELFKALVFRKVAWEELVDESADRCTGIEIIELVIRAEKRWFAVSGDLNIPEPGKKLLQQITNLKSAQERYLAARYFDFKSVGLESDNPLFIACQKAQTVLINQPNSSS